MPCLPHSLPTAMPQHPRRIRENQPTTAHDRSGASAALAAALDVIGDRWTLLVVNALMNGPRRFGELQDEVPDIAANILTQRLRRLERDALVVARPYSTRPLRMVYELTAAGAEL